MQAEKTYILLQPTNMDSRLWLEFSSVQKAADGVAVVLHVQHEVKLFAICSRPARAPSMCAYAVTVSPTAEL